MRIPSLVQVIMLSALLSSPAFGQYDGAHSVASLKGLHGVYVRVHLNGDSNTHDGVTPDQLWSDISLRLHVVGVNVLSDVDWKKTPGKPYLYVEIKGEQLRGLTDKNVGFVYSCSVDLMQEVSLRRDPGTTTFACTWSRASSVFLPGRDLSPIREVIGTLATEFANDIASQQGTKRTATSLP